MDTTMNESTANMEEDNYDEPIWKKKQNGSFFKQASYSRKNVNKFLDKDLGERNRELFVDLFNEDPNETACDENEFEKNLFADLKAPEEPQAKPAKKKATRKKQTADGENPSFLSSSYLRNLEVQKKKLRDQFEKSDVFQCLQKLKYTPLNIETVDHKGEVVKRIQYFYDYEKNKHEFVEVNNDGEEVDNRMETDTSPTKRKNDEDEEAAPKRRRAATKSTAATAKQQQRDDESEPATPKSRKRKMHFDDLNDQSISSFHASAIKSTSTPTQKKRLDKIDEREETANEEQNSKFDSNLVYSDSEEEFWVDLPAKKTASKAPAKSKAKPKTSAASKKTKASNTSKAKLSKAKSSKADTSTASNVNTSTASKADTSTASKANASTASTSKANTSSSKKTANTESTRPRRSARSKK